jgi:hypothetical protein
MNDFEGDKYSNKQLNPNTQNILVYPGNTEIALEVIRSLSNNKSYKLTVSKNSNQDEFLSLSYGSLTLPFVSENSDLIDVSEIEVLINSDIFLEKR